MYSTLNSIVLIVAVLFTSSSNAGFFDELKEVGNKIKEFAPEQQEVAAAPNNSHKASSNNLLALNNTSSAANLKSNQSKFSFKGVELGQDLQKFRDLYPDSDITTSKIGDKISGYSANKGNKKKAVTFDHKGKLYNYREFIRVKGLSLSTTVEKMVSKYGEPNKVFDGGNGGCRQATRGWNKFIDVSGVKLRDFMKNTLQQARVPESNVACISLWWANSKSSLLKVYIKEGEQLRVWMENNELKLAHDDYIKTTQTNYNAAQKKTNTKTIEF